MDISEIRKQVADTGRELLETGLVVRTWGNFSCRIDEDSFVITPTALSYEKMGPEDMVVFHISDGSYEGTRKPSSEKWIHASAYKTFKDVNFVIHTHQVYATSIGLTGPGSLDITPEEFKELGGVAWADYGLPGTKKLRKAVTKAMEKGAHTVMMLSHGTLICGKDKEEAVRRAALLEEICKRSCKKASDKVPTIPEEERKKKADQVVKRLKERYPLADIIVSEDILHCANNNYDILAQLDDMAQIAGRKLPSADETNYMQKVKGDTGCVLIKDIGAAVYASDPDDIDAFTQIVNKACIAELHTDALKKKSYIGILDSAIQRYVYLQKYAKKKDV